MKLKMKTTTLIKPLLIAVLTIANLHSALVYAAVNNNQTDKISRQIYVHALPLSTNEGGQLIIIKQLYVSGKNDTNSKVIINKKAKKTVNNNNLLTVNITQLHSLKQLTNLNIHSNVKLTLMPNKQELLPSIVKKAGGNKLFEMATKINDKLQLFIARFKKIFTAQNSSEQTSSSMDAANSSSQCNLNS